MSTTISFIDDTSPNITYSNGWSNGGGPDEFNSTTHGTTIAGSQASYTFKGSFIEVFGTIGRENNANPNFAPISTYTIDNNLDTAVTFTGTIGSITLYKQLLYTSTVLDESQPHTLVITYTTAGKNPLWLDYFRVTDTPIITTTSSTQTTLFPTTVSVVDDTSPDITYSNGWLNGGSSDEFNSTTHGAVTAGAQASYTFKGSFIEVFGTIGRENNGDPSFAATSTYTIDNNLDTAVTFTGVIGSTNLYKQLLYSSNVLDESQPHTLVITYTTADKNPLWLDYFRVSDTPITTTTTSSIASIPTAQPSHATSQSSRLSPGTIAGIAVGSCAALLLVVVIVLLLRSLNTRESRSRDEVPQTQRRTSWFNRLWHSQPPPPPPEIHPFNPHTEMSNYSHSLGPSIAHQYQAPSSGSSPSFGVDAPAYHLAQTTGSGYVTRGGRPDQKRPLPNAPTSLG
ncbi:hypothetical protein DXG01_011086 [Tephrocybe rancida]|nr:hypothetical protein DXG01_011086 [Tephrocybe rancida]